MEREMICEGGLPFGGYALKAGVVDRDGVFVHVNTGGAEVTLCVEPQDCRAFAAQLLEAAQEAEEEAARAPKPSELDRLMGEVMEDLDKLNIRRA